MMLLEGYVNTHMNILYFLKLARTQRTRQEFYEMPDNSNALGAIDGTPVLIIACTI